MLPQQPYLPPPPPPPSQMSSAMLMSQDVSANMLDNDQV
jgi:hypothetical protein